ncbi:hypothetical protein G3N96_16300 [Burkholderia sp. Se-20373]|uniref:hypothetical protein n=1 Tax=Burkholderia sp. Se-20373 TaxID=2703898 RepID=UPI00197FEA41|nr:hypothetical protein [Burkholderia sp. Se-20373]MBN3746982.1 hypothetical protein [Burkholderia sp. Se-20373]
MDLNIDGCVGNGDEGRALDVAVFAVKITTVSASQLMGVARKLGCHVTNNGGLLLLDVVRCQEISPSVALKPMA